MPKDDVELIPENPITDPLRVTEANDFSLGTGNIMAQQQLLYEAAKYGPRKVGGRIDF